MYHEKQLLYMKNDYFNVVYMKYTWINKPIFIEHIPIMIVSNKRRQSGFSSYDRYLKMG